MGHDLTRRAPLSATPAILAPSAPAAAPAPARNVVGDDVTADPHPALWAEWRRIRARHNTPGLSEAEADALCDRHEHVVDLLRERPATTPEGSRAQFAFMCEDLMEGGTHCALAHTWAGPFLDVFRAGLRAV